VIRESHLNSSRPMIALRRASHVCWMVVAFLYWGSQTAWGAPCDLIVSSGATTLANGIYSFCSVTVAVGATLVIGGAVTLNASGNVDIEGVVDGKGNGYGSAYDASTGPGTGSNGYVSALTGGTYVFGAGGGHGGKGGGVVGYCVGCVTVPGGVTYDSSTNPVLMGSAGGYGGTYAPGAGGGALIINASSGNVTLNGTVDMSGGDGISATVDSGFGHISGGGGGSGGTFSVDAIGFYGLGSILASGGLGGGTGGCGGGGGRVRFCASNGTKDYSGTEDVSGGIGAVEGGAFMYPGDAGSFYECVVNTPTPTMTATATETATLTPTVISSLTNTPTPTMTMTVISTVTPSNTPTLFPTPIPGCFYISRNTMRPASGEGLEILFCSNQDGRATLKVYNTAGELVGDLFNNGVSPGGQYQVAWDAKNKLGQDVASGIYILRLTLPSGAREAKVDVIR